MGILDNIRSRFSAKETNPLLSVPDDQIFIEANKRSGGSDINLKVVQSAPSGRAQDIGTMKQARRAALDPERPDRTLLYDLYDNTLLDGHLTSIIDTRILRILGSKFKVVNEKGENNPEMVQLLEREWFEEFQRLAMWSAFKGVRLIEISEILEGEINEVVPIPERNVNAKTGYIVKEVGNEEGWNYRKPPLSNYIVEVGMPNELGLLIKCAPYAIFKRYAMSSWSDFQEKFGVPPRWVTTTTTDKKRHKALFDMMQNLVSSSYAVFQGDETIDSMDVKYADAHETFDRLIARCNSEMSKIILGQDGTTDNKDASGTYGSLKVLQGVAEDRHKYDKTRMMHLINRELIPRMQLLGYSGLAGHRFVWDDFQELSAKEVVAAVKDLSQAYEFDYEELARRTGLPITGLRRLPGEYATGSNDPGQKKKPDLNAQITALYHSDHVCDPGSPTIKAATPAAVNVAIERIIREVYKNAGPATDINAQIALSIGDYMAASVSEIFGTSVSDGFEFDDYNNRLTHNLRNNIYAFSGAKNFAMMREMGAALVDENGGIKPFSQFKEEALKLNDRYNQTWLETEYNTAVSSSQMAANWGDLQANKDIMPNLTFRTAGDDRVSDDHARLDGTTLPIDHPFWDSNYPPLRHNCRCDALAASGRATLTDESVANERAAQTDVPPLFQQNVGKTGVIFKDEHPYFQAVDGNLFEMDAQANYGMRSAERITADPGRLAKSPGKKDPDTWYENKRKASAIGDDAIGLKTHTGNVVKVPREVLGESQYGHSAEKVLSAPNEVWQRKNETTYLRYHEDVTVAVTVDNSTLQAGKFQVYDQITIGQVDGVRKGVVMKK